MTHLRNGLITHVAELMQGVGVAQDIAQYVAARDIDAIETEGLRARWPNLMATAARQTADRAVAGQPVNDSTIVAWEAAKIQHEQAFGALPCPV